MHSKYLTYLQFCMTFPEDRALVICSLNYVIQSMTYVRQMKKRQCKISSLHERHLLDFQIITIILFSSWNIEPFQTVTFQINFGSKSYLLHSNICMISLQNMLFLSILMVLWTGIPTLLQTNHSTQHFRSYKTFDWHSGDIPFSQS